MNYGHGDTSLLAFRQHSHPDCFVCGQTGGCGLGLRFRVAEGGVVEASFSCEPTFEGYSGMLHGGVVCALLDGAMTNCLFAHGLEAVTEELNVRFRRAATTGRPVTVRARLASSAPPLHSLTAELLQDEQAVATAAGRFIEKHTMAWFT